MPAFIKTQKQEALWEKAKSLAEKSGHKEDWPYTTGIYKNLHGGKVAETASRVAERHLRQAALVGTDTAEIFAISPEQLLHLSQHPKFKALVDGDLGENMGALEKLVRQHGGAYFRTGGDGGYDVKIPTKEGALPIVKEEGYMEPYGTPGYAEVIKKVARRFLSASRGELVWTP